MRLDVEVSYCTYDIIHYINSPPSPPPQNFCEGYEHMSFSLSLSHTHPSPSLCASTQEDTHDLNNKSYRKLIHSNAIRKSASMSLRLEALCYRSGCGQRCN